MKKVLFVLFAFIGSFSFSQEYDFEQLCIACAESGGFYCGDDPNNWTQYSPEGCVQASWINDGWVDCVDSSDEGEGVVPTALSECAPPPPQCDTIYVDVPVVEYVYQIDTLEVPFYIYETLIQLDTIIQTEYITQIVVDTVEIETLVPEYIYITDTVTVYEDILDTLYVDVVEYVDSLIYDTIVEIEYVEFFVTDTVLEYVEIIETEYVDCESGLPCTSGVREILNNSKENNKMYSLLGYEIKRPEGVYIQNGKIKYKLN
tara:strand:- start:3818 stop:4597 length:780 start_codon:yes stop_codon:yes gene_type:complete